MTTYKFFHHLLRAASLAANSAAYSALICSLDLKNTDFLKRKLEWSSSSRVDTNGYPGAPG